jgi:hypothetical protein
MYYTIEGNKRQANTWSSTFMLRGIEIRALCRKERRQRIHRWLMALAEQKGVTDLVEG